MIDGHLLSRSVSMQVPSLVVLYENKPRVKCKIKIIFYTSTVMLAVCMCDVGMGMYMKSVLNV